MDHPDEGWCSEGFALDEGGFECLITRVEKKYPWMIMPLAVDGDVYKNNWADKEKTSIKV